MAKAVSMPAAFQGLKPFLVSMAKAVSVPAAFQVSRFAVSMAKAVSMPAAFQVSMASPFVGYARFLLNRAMARLYNVFLG